jgi:hypothetical protein
MAKPPLVRWSILILRSKAVWLRDVEASSEAEAIAKGAEEFGQPKERLMAVRRGLTDQPWCGPNSQRAGGTMLGPRSRATSVHLLPCLVARRISMNAIG